jgi:ribonuclease P protein component
MLAKKFRLTGAKNFTKIQKEGTVYQSSNFGIAYLKRGDINPSRFGFIVSTKIAKDAVDRNRFKRAMSEAVRIASIDLTSGFDVIFLAKTSIARVSTAEIMKEVRLSLKGSGLSR